jgi:hypothetical protein
MTDKGRQPPSRGFLHVIADLLRLRAGPQDLPDSRPLTLAVIIVYVAQAIITSDILSAGQAGADEQTLRSLLSIAIQFGAVGVILVWRRQPERLQQTIMAFAAAGTVISLLAFTLLLQADPGVNKPFLALLWFAIFGWSLAVDANIFRHSLEVSLPIAMLITVMLLALTYLLLELLIR